MKSPLLQTLVTLLVLFSVGTLSFRPAFLVPEKGSFRADSRTFRLPNETRPVSYDVQLETRVDQGDFNFTGRVKIVIEVLNVTSEIFLHARQLEIRSVELKTAYFVPEVINVTHTYEDVTEFLTISATDKPLVPMYYYLTIEYAGELRKDIGGFYVTSYKDGNKREVYIASTQFLATDARHAFPCYDEPAKKAVFKFTIKHGSNYFALSNMPVLQESIDNGDGTSTTTFQQSTLISTYLLAFTVCNFEYSERIARIPHRIYSRVGTKSEHDFALTASVRLLDAYENYFDAAYKLPKLDHIAIPGFLYAGMESWGLVMYREESLFFNNSRTTTLAQENIVAYMAHELAHQSFGNLVSPYWWTFIWLNNGLGSLLAYIATEKVFPEWDMWQRFHTEVYDLALQADGRENAKPMTHYVESTDEIESIFDEISYYKSASFLNMIRHALGTDVFQTAAKYYVQDMEFSSVDEDDLFRNFQRAIDTSNLPGTIKTNIFQLFKSWTNQEGFPLITVTRNYTKGTFTIRQSPFRETKLSPSPDERSWWVPFNFATSQNLNFTDTTMFDFLNVGEESKEVTNVKLTNADWIILNKKSTSYYRVNYDLDNWKLLAAALITNPGQFHTLNRAQLLDDSYAFALSRQTNFSTFLDLSLYLKKEIDYAPWAKANAILTEINKYLSGDSHYNLFQYYVGQIVGNLYSRIGATELNEENHMTKLTRSFAVNWACRTNHGDCLKVMTQEFRDFVQAGKRIQPNTMTNVFCFGLMNATEAEYEFMLNQLLGSTDEGFRGSLIRGAMGCMRNETLLKRYLSTAFQLNNYNIEEQTNILPSVASMGSKQFEVVIDFLTANHAEYSKIPPLYHIPPLVSAVGSIASTVVNHQQNTKFEGLLTKLQDYSEIQDASDVFRSIVESNLVWVTQYQAELTDWLINFKNFGEGGSTNAAVTTFTSIGAAMALIVVTIKSFI